MEILFITHFTNILKIRCLLEIGIRELKRHFIMIAESPMILVNGSLIPDENEVCGGAVYESILPFVLL